MINKPKKKYYREIQVPSTEIKFSGNRYIINLSLDLLRKNDLEIGERVRPILLIRKAKYFKEIALPITNIVKYGNSACIPIIKPMMRRWRLECGQLIHPYLFVRETLNTGEFPDNEYIIIKHGEVSTIKKGDWIEFTQWKHDNDNKQDIVLQS